MKTRKTRNATPSPLTNAERARAYERQKAKTVLSNVGFWFLLAFDILYLIVLILNGYEPSYLVTVCLLLALEIVAVLFLLPVPLLQLGIIKRHKLYAIVFLLPCGAELSWSIYVSAYNGAGAVYGIFTAARFVMWAAAFFLSRKGWGTGGSAVVLSFLAAVFAIGFAGAVFAFPLNARPMRYELRQDPAQGEVYAVTGILNSPRNNVRIPERYKGKQVTVIDTGEKDVQVRSLHAPASIEGISLRSSSLRSLTVASGGTPDFGNFSAPDLRLLRFSADSMGLPQNFPVRGGEESGIPEGCVIEMSPAQTSYCLHADGENIWTWRDNFVPAVADGEGYVMRYTDCALPESGHIADFSYAVAVTSGTGETVLDTPDLTEKGYAFIGWYDSRDYEGRNPAARKVTRVANGTRQKLYAKYLKLYDVALYENDDAASPAQTLSYHNESDPLYLPAVSDAAWQKQDYAFCGWFPHGATPQKGDNVTVVPTGSRGDLSYYPVYKELFSVTVHADGGRHTLPATYHEWSEEEPLPDAEKEGYTFRGWYYDEDFSEPVYFLPQEDECRDVDLYAKFNRNHTVTLHANGGTVSGSVPAYFHKETLTFDLPSPHRTGYTFDGWFRSETGGSERVSRIEYGTDEDVTLYARWTPVTYRVYYYSADAQDGGSTPVTGTAPPVQTFTYDAENTLADCPFVRGGYTFAGWKYSGKTYEAGEKGVFNFLTTAGDVFIVPVWKANTFTVAFACGFDGGISDMRSRTATFDDYFTFPACTYVRTGYEFSHWEISGNAYEAGSEHRAVFCEQADGTVTAVAVWTPITYRIEFTARAGSTTDTQTVTVTYDRPFSAPLCKTKRDGYTFAGWKIANESVLYAAGERISHNFSSVAGTRISATAEWKANTYSVLYEEETGAMAAERSEFTFDAPSELRAYTATKRGYTFGGWRIGGTVYPAGERRVFNLTTQADGTVRATVVWDPVTYTVRFRTGYGDNKVLYTQTYTFGTENPVPECAHKRAGYNFESWQVARGESEWAVLTPGTTTWALADEEGAIVDAEAHWKEIVFTVVLIDGDERTEVEVHAGGTGQSLPSPKKDGYMFLGWRIRGSLWGAGSTMTAISDTAGDVVEAVAEWQEIR